MRKGRTAWIISTISGVLGISALFLNLRGVSDTSRWINKESLFVQKGEGALSSASRQLSPPRMVESHSSSSVQQTTKTTRSRVLMGIFCRMQDVDYRQQFRKLFQLHPNVCSWGQYQEAIRMSSSSTTSKDGSDDDCHLIYTFVIGANPQAPTKIVNNETDSCFVSPQTQKNMTHGAEDDERDDDDLTLLNIQENMNEGKSTTWFHCASSSSSAFLQDIEYIGKMDTDTLPYLDRFMERIHSWPPAPYNKNTVIGHFLDKTWTWRRTGANPHKEQYFYQTYEHIHPYAAGELYIFSNDVAATLAKHHDAMELEGIEDHDQTTMAMLHKSDVPIKLHMVNKDQMWWKHPVKKQNLRFWEETWKAEQTRIASMFNKTAIVSSSSEERNSTNTEDSEQVAIAY